MEKIKLVMGAPIQEQYLAQIRAYCDVTQYPVEQWAEDHSTEQEIIDQFNGYEIVVVYSHAVTERCIRTWKENGMRLLVCPRGTPVNVDWKAVKKYDIPLVYAPGRNAVCVAEHTIGLMLALVKNIGFSYHMLMTGKFMGPPKENIYDVTKRDDVYWVMADGSVPEDYLVESIDFHERTLGIAGFGSIGSRVAKMAQAFDMRVIAYDPYCSEERIRAAGAEKVDLDTLLAESEFLSIHLAVTPETIGMVNKSWFDKMRPSAFVINTARAATIDQKDFVEALQQHKIAGAALDVCWEEAIPANHPLLQMPNVLITPHQGSYSKDVAKWQSAMMAEDIIAYCKGEPLKYLWKRSE